jgi:hypothetical protein
MHIRLKLKWQSRKVNTTAQIIQNMLEQYMHAQTFAPSLISHKISSTEAIKTRAPNFPRVEKRQAV